MNTMWCRHYGEQHGGSLKSKNRATIWSCTPTPGHTSREKHNLKRHMHPSIHISTIYSGQDVQFKCPSTDKYKHVVHRKEWNNAIWSSMDGPRDYHTKKNKPTNTNVWYVTSKKKKERYKLIYNLFTTQKQTHWHGEWIYDYHRGGEERVKSGVWD